MSNYTSENTKVLATHDVKHLGETNTRMLLMHEFENGRTEYVIGSYFTESIEYMEPGIFGACPDGIIVDRHGDCYDVESGRVVGQAANSLSYQDPEYYSAALANAKEKGKRVHYSWDWGHYFNDVVHAVDYWKREVIGEDTDRFMCPDCSGVYQEHPVELVHENGWWTCPMCGCSTAHPEEDACIRIEG